MLNAELSLTAGGQLVHGGTQVGKKPKKNHGNKRLFP